MCIVHSHQHFVDADEGRLKNWYLCQADGGIATEHTATVIAHLAEN